MKKLILSLAFLALISSPKSFAADADCSYCGAFDKLMQDFKKTPANPENEKTADAQVALVERSTTLLLKILKPGVAKLSEDDWVRFGEVLASVSPYDSEDLAATIMLKLGSHTEAFYAEMRALREEKKLSKGEAEAAINLISGPDAERHNGNGGE